LKTRRIGVSDCSDAFFATGTMIAIWNLMVTRFLILLKALTVIMVLTAIRVLAVITVLTVVGTLTGVWKYPPFPIFFPVARDALWFLFKLTCNGQNGQRLGGLRKVFSMGLPDRLQAGSHSEEPKVTEIKAMLGCCLTER
jgi:hypothetical protein